MIYFESSMLYEVNVRLPDITMVVDAIEIRMPEKV